MFGLRRVSGGVQGIWMVGAHFALLPDTSLGVCLFLRRLRGLDYVHGHVVIGFCAGRGFRGHRIRSEFYHIVGFKWIRIVVWRDRSADVST